MTLHYEPAVEYQAPGYKINSRPDVAWRVLGYETLPDEDTEWSGYEPRAGRLVCVMVGDDRKRLVDPDDLTPLDGADFCAECGQMGCSHGSASEL